MKNIFKSLMFVAVAAMTFTACEKDNAENNNNNGTEQKTAITFNAEFADTRSYFTGNNGEGYASAWTEGDEVKFQAANYDSAGGYWAGVGNPTAYIDENNCLSATFNGIQGGDIIKAYSPATKWNVSVSMYGIAEEYTIPSEQTPTATSVDPQAHILMAETTYTGSNNMSLTFAHQVAYGKFSLTNFAGTDATAVILDIDGAKYTIKLDNINIATEPIWFACEPNGKVNNMTVTVNATEGSYTKQIITGGDKNLEFLQGQVSNFSVDMNGATSGEAVDTFNPDVNMTYNSLSGDTLKFNAEGYTYIYLYLNSNDHTSNSIKTGTYKCSGGATAPAQSGKIGVKYNDGWPTTIYDTNMDIIVDFDGNDYIITFTYGGKLYGYKGMPDGWVAPAGGGNEGGEEPEPVQLATPANVNCEVSGANVTITWDAVANASSYNVTLGEQTQSANTTTATFENVAAGTYNVKVVAVGTGNYTNSEAANAEVTVEAAGEGGGEVVTVTNFTYTGNPLTKYTCTLTCSTGENVTFKVNFISTNSTYNFADSSSVWDIKVGDTAASQASGTIFIDGEAIATLNDLIINGVSYVGSVSL